MEVIERPGCLATQRCLSFVNLHSKKVSNSTAKRGRIDSSLTRRHMESPDKMETYSQLESVCHLRLP